MFCPNLSEFVGIFDLIESNVGKKQISYQKIVLKLIIESSEKLGEMRSIIAWKNRKTGKGIGFC